MSETTAVADAAVAVVSTPEAPAENKKPKLAKAKKVAPPATQTVTNPDGTTSEVPVEKPKRQAPPRVSPHAGKFIYFTDAGRQNPKRAGTKCYDAYAMYVEGRTVEEQVEAWKGKIITKKSGKEAPVGDMTDINWDVGHGYIVLESRRR